MATSENAFFYHYGGFMGLWSTFEMMIEIAIMRELKISPENAHIVFASINFSAKANILASLLSKARPTMLLRA